MRPPLAYRRWWQGLGVAMVLLVTTLSLVRLAPDLPLQTPDKLNHLLAYAAMMYWWGMVQPDAQRWWSIGLLGLGLLIELAQAYTGYRFFEAGDLLANAAGIACGLLLLRTPARQLLECSDAQLRDRFNPRRP